MSLKELMAGLLLCLTFNTLLAEVRIYEGKVMDNSGNPLEFANVALQSLEDSTLIDGSVTDADYRQSDFLFRRYYAVAGVVYAWRGDSQRLTPYGKA